MLGWHTIAAGVTFFAMKLKQLFPVWLKKLPWYIWKAPQRQLGFFNSWKTEINGITYWLGDKILKTNNHNLQSVSICTGIKNRTENYLRFVLPSILAMHHKELIEISIFDCNSDDYERFKTAVEQQWNGKLVITTEDVKFTRSYSFNKAIQQSTNPLIFACDSDLTLPADLVEKCNKFVTKKTVWFPVFFNLNEGAKAEISKKNGNWHWVSRGMFAAYKWQFNKIGCFDERFVKWGGEDDELWMRFFKYGFLPIRTRLKGMFHHYHPSVSIPKQEREPNWILEELLKKK